MTNGDRKPSGLLAALESGQRLGAQDVARDDQRQEQGSIRGRVPLDQISLRVRDTRRIAGTHVQTLRASIAALGLIEPIVIDLKGRLLAGGHRYAALRQLRDEEPEVFARHFPDGSIPIRQMPIDAEVQPAEAMAIEVAENEQRRDYTAQEIRALALKLKDAGYREIPGRPKEGEKALGPALRTIVGKSFRTIRRVLADRSAETVPSGTISQEQRHDRIRVALRQKLTQARILCLQLGGEPSHAVELIDQIIGMVGEPPRHDDEAQSESESPT